MIVDYVVRSWPVSAARYSRSQLSGAEGNVVGPIMRLVQGWPNPPDFSIAC